MKMLTAIAALAVVMMASPTGADAKQRRARVAVPAIDLSALLPSERAEAYYQASLLRKPVPRVRVARVALHKNARSLHKNAVAPPDLGAPAVVQAARRYVGTVPTVDQLKGWAQDVGIGAWRHGRAVYCALGVNKVLADVGQAGTRSGLARSFLTWGRPAAHPSPGDVVIYGRKGGGHVAIVTAVTPLGLQVVSFNSNGHAVVEGIYPRQALAVRTAAN